MDGKSNSGWILCRALRASCNKANWGLKFAGKASEKEGKTKVEGAPGECFPGSFTEVVRECIWLEYQLGLTMECWRRWYSVQQCGIMIANDWSPNCKALWSPSKWTSLENWWRDGQTQGGPRSGKLWIADNKWWSCDYNMHDYSTD